jgi:hypothetical protein
MLAAETKAAAGPVLGGSLVTLVSWRLIFAALSWLATSRPATSRPAVSRPAKSGN